MTNNMTQLQSNLIENMMHHLENIMIKTKIAPTQKDVVIMQETIKTTENLSKLIDTFPTPINNN
jgi:hypothetical protein